MLKNAKLAIVNQKRLVFAGLNFSSLPLNFVGGTSEYNFSPVTIA
jgi:hypothetical protein